MLCNFKHFYFFSIGTRNAAFKDSRLGHITYQTFGGGSDKPKQKHSSIQDIEQDSHMKRVS